MGGHAGSKDNSLLEYSRDALAGPLNELRHVFDKIQAGAFDPDCTRSGRWATIEKGEKMCQSQPPEQTKCGAGGGIAAADTVDNSTEKKTKKRRVDLAAGSQGPAGATEEEDEEFEEKEAEEDKGAVASSACESPSSAEASGDLEQLSDPEEHKLTIPAPMVKHGFIANSNSMVAHRAAADGFFTACGYLMTADVCQFAEELPQGCWRFCRKVRCFPTPKEPRYTFQGRQA